MFFAAFRAEGIGKRAAAVCDARHLLAESGNWFGEGRCGRDERRRNIKPADSLGKQNLGAKDCALHALTTLA
jgi:hypothetical protein